MKRKTLLLLFLFASIFCIVNISETVHEVQACDIPIPLPNVPEPPLC